MTSSLLSSLPKRLLPLRRGLLPATLVILYLVLWQGPDSLLGRTLFVAHLGLFMLWQPFVHAEQRLSLASVLGLVAIVLVGTAFMKGWMLLLWIMMLAGIVGGKVMLFDARASRLFYLLALGFLVVALVVLAVPQAVPLAKPPQTILSLAYLGLPLVLVVMVMLPQGKDADGRSEVVDFVYSLLVFLLLAVLMLGSLAVMQIIGSDYIDALLQSVMGMGVTLLLLGLAWNPHSGFSGIGGLFSRYLMSIGMPVERWLKALADLALREDDPRVFLQRSCDEIMLSLRWVSGGVWTAGRNSERFGSVERHKWEFIHGGMVLVLYTRYSLSPALIWHCNLLAQLLAQFHADKQRALALKHLSYMQAIHETGARLTHDVKNLLQSLNTLCSAGIEPGAESSTDYRALLRRQLPAITDRLAETLGKLSAPEDLSAAHLISAAEWWAELRQRIVGLAWIAFKAPDSLEGKLPAEVFSGVADNLIRNVAEKHLREPSLLVQVELVGTDAGYEMIVCDDGSAMPEDIAAGLFIGPVASETGYGIGLYHAGRYARAAGYALELTENRPGQVCFRLTQATPSSSRVSVNQGVKVT